MLSTLYIPSLRYALHFLKFSRILNQIEWGVMTSIIVCVCVCVAFVKGEEVEKFPTLQVRYKKGANPTLKLLDDTKTVQDTLA